MMLDILQTIAIVVLTATVTGLFVSNLYMQRAWKYQRDCNAEAKKGLDNLTQALLLTQQTLGAHRRHTELVGRRLDMAQDRIDRLEGIPP